MADYWKSNPKKFCEICKCWLADNKVSIQNHENGMRHKGNVTKKVNELTRCNQDAAKDKKNLEGCLQKINDSAHVSMMKDLERDPSLAKRYGIILADPDKFSSKVVEPNDRKVDSNPLLKSATWRTATTADGKQYYWNTVTRETQWTRPDGIIEPEQISVKEEKGRLQQFVFQRLVELSESGSEEANEAVLQAFNVPVSENSKEEKIASSSVIPKNSPKDDENLTTIQFGCPKVNLLGNWIPCDESPKPKLPKLDLPFQNNDSTSILSSSEKLALIAHLEETADESLEKRAHLELNEKTITPGSIVSSKHKNSTNFISKSEPSTEFPRIVFRRHGVTSTQRSLRSTNADE